MLRTEFSCRITILDCNARTAARYLQLNSAEPHHERAGRNADRPSRLHRLDRLVGLVLAQQLDEWIEARHLGLDVFPRSRRGQTPRYHHRTHSGGDTRGTDRLAVRSRQCGSAQERRYAWPRSRTTPGQPTVSTVRPGATSAAEQPSPARSAADLRTSSALEREVHSMITGLATVVSSPMQGGQPDQI